MAEGAAWDVHHLFDDLKKGSIENLHQLDSFGNPWERFGFIFEDLGKNFKSARFNYGEIAGLLEQLYSLPVESIKQFAAVNQHLFNTDIFNTILDKGIWNPTPQFIAQREVFDYLRGIASSVSYANVAFVGAASGWGVDALRQELATLHETLSAIVDMFDIVPLSDDVFEMQGDGSPLSTQRYDAIFAPCVLSNPFAAKDLLMTFLRSAVKGALVVLTDMGGRTPGMDAMKGLLLQLPDHVHFDASLEVVDNKIIEIIKVKVLKELSHSEAQALVEMLPDPASKELTLYFGDVAEHRAGCGPLTSTIAQPVVVHTFYKKTTGRDPVVYGLQATQDTPKPMLYLGSGMSSDRAYAHGQGKGSRVIGELLTGKTREEIDHTVKVVEILRLADVPQRLLLQLLGPQKLWTQDRVEFILRCLESRILYLAFQAASKDKAQTFELANQTTGAHGHRSSCINTNSRKEYKLLADANPGVQVGAGGGRGNQWMDKSGLNDLHRDKGLDGEDGRVSKRQKTFLSNGQDDEAANAGIVVALLPQGYTFPGGGRQEEFSDPAAAERAISCALGISLTQSIVAQVIRNGTISMAGTQIRSKADLPTRPFIADYVQPNRAQAVVKMLLVSKPGTPFKPQQRVYKEVGRYTSIRQAVASVTTTTYKTNYSSELKKAADDKSEWKGFFWKIE